MLKKYRNERKNEPVNIEKAKGILGEEAKKDEEDEFEEGEDVEEEEGDGEDEEDEAAEEEEAAEEGEGEGEAPEEEFYVFPTFHENYGLSGDDDEATPYFELKETL